MLICHRQGWRLFIVLSRLALAFLLTTGLSVILESGSLFAQTDPDSPPKPPPPRRPPVHPPDPLATDSPPELPASSPVPQQPAVQVGPTLAQPLTAEATTPILLSLPPSLERLTARRNSLNQVLCKDRRHRLLLLHGDSALSAGDHTAALLHFQALNDAPEDAFYWPAGSSQPCGALASVHDRFRSLSAEARQTYERLHGEEARALLQEALTSDDKLSQLYLLRRFPQTAAGRDLMVRELLHAYDCGQTAWAALFAKRLADDVDHWQQLSPQLHSLISRIVDVPDPSTLQATSTDVSPPALRPLWAYSFADGLQETAAVDATSDPVRSPARLSAALADSAQQWFAERQERRFPTATTNQAAVFGDLLVVRDYAGIRAMDVRNGQRMWHCPCAGSLVAAARVYLREEARGGGAPLLNFQTHFAGRGPLGQLRSDDRLLFFLDEVPCSRSAADQQNEHAPDQPAGRNRLVALPLHPSSPHPEPVWVQPGPVDETLAGHHFLGPPLPVDGRLFLLTEHADRIECIALDATDGRILWRQPIALSQHPIDWDVCRQRIACSPQYAASTLICPTEVGVLVGIDPLTGTLRWVYDHIDDDQRHSAGRWSSSTQRNFGSAELPSRTLVHAGRVLHLPFRSQFVHCVDATTGAPVWTAPREEALCLSAVSDRDIILIGQRKVTSLSPADGSVQWTAPCPEPAGHGIIAGDEYLLPLVDGRCLSMSLDDGTLRGSRFSKLLHELATPDVDPASKATPVIQLVSHQPDEPATSLPQPMPSGGNLTSYGDLIVMTMPTRVAVFPMSAALLERLQTQAGATPLADDEQLQAALLHLLLDDHITARTGLEELLRSSHSPTVTRRAARMLRELLFAELESTDDPRSTLRQLSQLPGDDADTLRLLVSRIEAEIQLGDLSGLVAALEEFRRLNPAAVIRRDGDAGYLVNACDEVSDRLTEFLSTHSTHDLTVLSQHLTALIAQAGQSADVSEVEMIVKMFDGWPQVAGLRNDLAADHIAAGLLQQAELLLLKNCNVPNRPAAARAHRLLIELYASAGLHREAAANLLRLDDLYRDLEVGNGLSCADFVAQFSRNHPVWQIVQRRREIPPAAYRVQITQHLCNDACGEAVQCRCDAALDHHSRIRRKFLTGDDASVTIIDRGIVTADRSRSSLCLVNRETGLLYGEVDVPSAYWQLAAGGDGYCGGLLPVCGRSAHGLSLLEKRPVWSTAGDDDAQQHDKVKIGPVGHDYCVLQTSRNLSVIHPATGQLRWSHNDLSPNVGLLSNESTGIIGDERTLTIFDADQISYTVYRMRSGRQVRRGRLDLHADDVRRHRRGYGDRLVHVVSDEEGDRLRVWNSTSDRLLVDEPLHERLYTPIPDRDQYAFVSAEGEFVVVDVLTGNVETRMPLPAELLDDAGELNVAADPECYFVNLVGCNADNPGDTAAALDEVELPAMRVQGQLLAVSRSGRLQWSRPVDDAALLTHSQCRLPILTLVTRVRDPDQKQQATLRIEVLDIRTGQSLARRDDLQRTRLVQADYQHRRGQLKLIGLDSRIDVDFAPSSPEMLIHAELDPGSDSLLR